MQLSNELIELNQPECAEINRLSLVPCPDLPEPIDADSSGSRQVDLRESLSNDHEIGPIHDVSLCLERITRLHGIMIDLDPKFLEPGNPLFPPAAESVEFFKSIEAVIDRHPVLKDAEVRSSGSGLHVLLWLDPPVEMQSEDEQHYWDAIVKAVQASLPSDPNAPSITAMTRPIGSINSKNGAKVMTLRPGRPIDHQRVIEYVEQLANAPFRGVAQVLLVGDRIEPCPVCKAGGSRFTALDWVGKCYSCGQVDLEKLFGLICRAEKENFLVSMDQSDSVQQVVNQNAVKDGNSAASLLE